MSALSFVPISHWEFVLIWIGFAMHGFTSRLGQLLADDLYAALKARRPSRRHAPDRPTPGPGAGRAIEPSTPIGFSDRPAPGRSELDVTSQGHPSAIFARAIDAGDLVTAESVLAELGWVTIANALELTALIALHDTRRARRATGRWLQRYIAELTRPTLDHIALVAAQLGRLGGPEHEEALAALRGMAARASSGRSHAHVA